MILFFLLLWTAGNGLVLSNSCSSTKQKPQSNVASTPSRWEASSPEEDMKRGWLQFNRGAFDEAITHWSRAAQSYEKDSEPLQMTEALFDLSQAYHATGQYKKALKSLETALDLAKKSGQRAQIGTALGYLGNVYIGMGEAQIAYGYLTQGLEIAREIENPDMTATILNNLGNLRVSRREYDEALMAYKQSVTLSMRTGNHLMAAVALTNWAMTSMRIGNYNEARSLLDEALEELKRVDDSYQKAFALINVGIAYGQLRKDVGETMASLNKLAAEALNEALFITEKNADLRTASYALGYLGELYETEQQYEEGLQLTRRAIFAAQQISAPESLYRWHWQAGRILKVLGRMDEALSAYRHSVDALQDIRQEMSVCYSNPESSYRKTAGSVCFEFVDLLLKRSATVRETDRYEHYLVEVRETLELLKVFELRDYFKDDCVDAARTVVTKLDTVSKTAIVIYPVLLNDRMELLATLPSGLKKYTVQVKAEEITREIREFRKLLEKRTTGEFLDYAQRMYDWLIRPLKDDLAGTKVDTLVMVPDGPLRTIPLAALHDGEHFLINKYSTAITPGLNLTDPRAIQLENAKVLAVGLTDPVRGYASLPHVSEELQIIEKLYGGHQLLNKEFSLLQMESELRNEKFNILHVASHGQFGTDAEDSFVLTFDGRLTMDRLGEFVGLFRFRDDPLDLLTLSACETAAGDDRAALGFAGVAVRAGARSALATLWHINDPASSDLVAEFYRQLQGPGVSRASALRSAQLKLLRDPRYEHPGYWAPFLLINNWL